MGELVNGIWHRDGIDSVIVDGGLRRPPSVFRDRVTADGSADPGRPGFRAEPVRYHLYVSLACPWAHRTLIMRTLKGLEDLVGLSVVHWLMGDDGWTFAPAPGVVPDTVNGVTVLHELYTRAVPDCTSRVTVPVLWDTRQDIIISNESAEILRMFNCAFDAVGAASGDYYPPALRPEIDAVNARIYDGLNNGVYRAGFATEQRMYETAVAEVFATLDWLEALLSGQSYLVGDRLTEADVRLFTTLIRFDAVYHGHFKCNWRRVADYPALQVYTTGLFHHPAFGPTTDFQHIKNHYYQSHSWLNPSRIVPIGPKLGFGDLLPGHEGTP